MLQRPVPVSLRRHEDSDRLFRLDIHVIVLPGRVRTVRPRRMIISRVQPHAFVIRRQPIEHSILRRRLHARKRSGHQKRPAQNANTTWPALFFSIFRVFLIVLLLERRSSALTSTHHEPVAFQYPVRSYSRLRLGRVGFPSVRKIFTTATSPNISSSAPWPASSSRSVQASSCVLRSPPCGPNSYPFTSSEHPSILAVFYV